MQLLDSSTTALAQCVAICFVNKPAHGEDDVHNSVLEPMMLSSPIATVSMDSLSGAVRELVGYLSATLTAPATTKKSIAASLLNEESSPTTLVRTYRPLVAQGISLHYRFIRDDHMLRSVAAHLLAANDAGGSETDQDKGVNVPASVAGVVYCVGITGLSMSNASSSLHYSLPQRISNCLTLIVKTDAKETATVKSILSSFLLSDNEQRKTNDMAASFEVLLFQAAKASDKSTSSMGMISPRAGTRKMTGSGTGIGTTMGRDSDGGRSGLNLPGSGILLSLEPSGASLARGVSEQLKVLAISETDAILRKYTVSSQERKANLDLTGGNKSRFSRRKTNSRGATRDPDFDNFDYKGPARMTTEAETLSVSAAPAISPTIIQPKQSVGSIIAPVPALAAARADVGHNRRVSISSANSQPPSQRNRGSRKGSTAQFVGGDDDTLASGMSDNNSRRRRSSGHTFEDDASNMSDGRSAIASQGQIQVNIALNEDLSCSYKLSELSSCSVEGVVQVQVRTSGRTSGPFMLVLRDPLHHIESLQENKKFADDLGKGHELDYNFAINIAKSESYTPVIRYKCVGSLRPVPLRVQTRVKADGEFCRVALQISSNPNNDSSLTDLTIIMGVPDEVIGESIVTQPEGGVWNASKRSVIWCVSELGNGEKFQLQARFEMGDIAYDSSMEKPKFPVLIRSQCLLSQLSSVEIDVRDIPSVFPADIEMKLAQRYRIAHRERS